MESNDGVEGDIVEGDEEGATEEEGGRMNSFGYIDDDGNVMRTPLLCTSVSLLMYYIILYTASSNSES